MAYLFNISSVACYSMARTYAFMPRCRKFQHNTDSLLTDNYDTWHREIQNLLQMKRDYAFEVFVLQSINGSCKA